MPSLPIPTLMLVTDVRTAGGEDPLVVKVGDAVAGGVNVVQMRAKGMDPREQVTLAKRLKETIAGRALLVVNGRLTVAEAVEADGLHLAEADEHQIRADKQVIFGRSVHSVEAARRAGGEGADYVIAGPVYETPTHPGARATGVRLIEAIVGAVSVPVIAIGGISAERVPEVMAAGAAGVAVISAVLAADDAQTAARELWAALSASRPLVAG